MIEAAKLLDPRSLLPGAEFIHCDNKIFRDREGLSGLCIDGKFSDIEELKPLCDEFEVYIHSIRKEQQYIVCYGCREKETAAEVREKLQNLPAFPPRIRKTNESLLHK